MQQLLCDPEDRLGSQSPSVVSRSDLYGRQGRRSGFMQQTGSPTSVDGAHLIKVCSSFHNGAAAAHLFPLQGHAWFKGIDWENIHRYPAPYRPELRSPEDTRHFDSDIPAEVSSAERQQAAPAGYELDIVIEPSD